MCHQPEASSPGLQMTLMASAHPRRSREAPPTPGTPYRALPSPTPTYPPSAGLLPAPGDAQRHSCNE